MYIPLNVPNTTETILTRRSGDRVQIVVSIQSNFAGDAVNVRVSTKAKGKRLWKSVIDFNDWDYRQAADRNAYERQKILGVITENELQEAINKWFVSRQKAL